MASTRSSVLEKERTAHQLEEPPMYKVVMYNDDFTPFDFVILVAQHVFGKTEEQAAELAARIHVEGKGVCGIYPKDIAEFKQKKAMGMARAEEHPLECQIEPETPAPSRGHRM